MYLVEKENEHISNGRFDTAHAYLHAREYKSAEPSLVHRVLLDLQRLLQEISIGVDLSNHYPDSERYRLACLATFFSLTTSRTSVHSLAVDDPTFSQVDDLLAHDRAGLMASLSTIHTPKSYIHDWRSRAGQDAQPLFTKILRSAKQLRHLTFNITMQYHEEVSLKRNCQLLGVPSEVLLTGHYSNLETLELIHFAVSEYDLSHILRQCQASLTRLILRRVRLKSDDEGWKRIGEILIKAPRLAYVQIQILYASNEPYGRAAEEWKYMPFECSEIKDGKPPGIVVNGRENVAQALGQLSQLGVSLFEELS